MAGIVCYLISRIPMFLFSLYGPLYAAYALFICGNPKVNAITRARFPENGFRKTCAHFPECLLENGAKAEEAVCFQVCRVPSSFIKCCFPFQ